MTDLGRLPTNYEKPAGSVLDAYNRNGPLDHFQTNASRLPADQSISHDWSNHGQMRPTPYKDVMQYVQDTVDGTRPTDAQGKTIYVNESQSRRNPNITPDGQNPVQLNRDNGTVRSVYPLISGGPEDVSGAGGLYRHGTNASTSAYPFGGLSRQDSNVSTTSSATYATAPMLQQKSSNTLRSIYNSQPATKSTTNSTPNAAQEYAALPMAHSLENYAGRIQTQEGGSLTPATGRTAVATTHPQFTLKNSPQYEHGFHYLAFEDITSLYMGSASKYYDLAEREQGWYKPPPTILDYIKRNASANEWVKEICSINDNTGLDGWLATRGMRQQGAQEPKHSWLPVNVYKISTQGLQFLKSWVSGQEFGVIMENRKGFIADKRNMMSSYRPMAVFFKYGVKTTYLNYPDEPFPFYEDLSATITRWNHSSHNATRRYAYSLILQYGQLYRQGRDIAVLPPQSHKVPDNLPKVFAVIADQTPQQPPAVPQRPQQNVNQRQKDTFMGLPLLPKHARAQATDQLQGVPYRPDPNRPMHNQHLPVNGQQKRFRWGFTRRGR